MKAILKEELDRLEKLGIIKSVDTPTDWVSSLVVVKKPSGKLRICIDPKPLNKALKRNLYPLPVIDDLLPDFAKAKVFTICDVKDGFWHVRLDEESSFLTTFGTPFGRYRWVRMPFGIAPAPECFQQRLDQAIEGLPGVRTVADDILISGEGDTVEGAIKDHDEKLLAFLERCRGKGVKLNKEKLKLKLTEVPYVGHLLTSSGLKPDPSKVEAVQSMPRPVDVKGVQRLIGLVNYLSRFLVGLADVCEPLRRLTRQDSDWQWNEQQESAFVKIKELISNAPVLRYFDPSLEMVLQCDASDTGLGASLIQKGQPVAYASRSLSSAERNYAQIEKELLAIVFGIERFNQYTYGRKVLVESDHKPLEAIYKKPLVAAPRRLQRMLMRLQKYDLEIRFKPGKHMFVADTLSRAPLTGVVATDEVLAIEKEIEEIQMADFVPIRQRSFKEIQEASQRDATMRALEKVIRCGWPEDKKKLERSVTPYFQIRDQLTVQEGVVYYGSRCVVPVACRAGILSKIHRSHVGMEGCLRRARESVYWPGMNAAVKELVSRCEICRTYEVAQPKEKLYPHQIPKRPWSKVAVDLFELDQKQYLVTVDYYSNFWEVDQLASNVKSKTIIEKLRQQFARHGIPDVLISDNGPQFVSSEFKSFAETWEFQHTTSSPGHAQSNGMAESAVKIIKRLVKKAKIAGTDPWLAILDYRNTPTEGLSSSPVQRLMSRRTKTTLPCKSSLLKPRVVADVTKEKQNRKDKQALYYNKNAHDLPELSEGDVVRVQPLDRPRKSWQKACVQKKVGLRSYEVQTEGGISLRRNRRYLKKTQEEPFGLVVQSPRLASQNNGGNVESDRNGMSSDCDGVSSPVASGLVGYGDREGSPEIIERRTRSGRISKRPSYLQDYVH